MNQRYQNFRGKSFLWLVLFLTGFLSNNVFSQTTISTETGTNYTGTSGITTPGAITFVVQNTNASAITVRSVDMFLLTNFNNATYRIWYSTSSLAGAATIASPAWTLAGVSSPVSVPVNDYYNVFSSLAIVVPANTQYRFAIESSAGINYSGATATPNNFSAGGVTLKTGNATVGAANVGYGGAFPTPPNNPRFFTGRVTFVSGAVACNLPAGLTTSADTSICGGGSAHLRVTGGTLGDAVNWKWYSSSCGGAVIDTGRSITVSPTATTTYYVRGEGNCVVNSTCSPVVVTLNPNPGTPTPNAAGPICRGSVAPISINAFALTPGSVTVNSSALTLAIPDNTANGVNTSLTVAGVPAGATITGIDVTLDVTHTYVSDLIINLRAPNGQILNLDKYCTGTGNDGENFVNTVISSAGVNALGDGTAPYTGTFKADAINTPLGATVENPAGFTPTAAGFPNLYSTPNGSWTLALADGGPADVGTLTHWAITIRYTTSAPASPAVWSPAASLFTDAAGTVAYDGVTPTFQVYAAPAVTTTYEAVSVLNGCPSAPASLDLTVNNPAALTSSPVNKIICENGNTELVVKATGTTPSYQWYSNISGSFAPLADNANFSGVTKDTLTIQNAPVSWNGAQFYCKVTSVAPCTFSANSNNATLTINPTPTVSLGASGSTNLLPGLTSTLSVASTPAAATYSWFNNNNSVADASGASYLVDINKQGVYKVSVVDINGCTNTSNAVEISDSVSTKLFIYPNPNNGQFQVSYYSVKNNRLPRTLTIYDASGRLVMNKGYDISKPYQGMNVDFRYLGAGVYVVNLLDAAGNRLAAGKVIVK